MEHAAVFLVVPEDLKEVVVLQDVLGGATPASLDGTMPCPKVLFQVGNELWSREGLIPSYTPLMQEKDSWKSTNSFFSHSPPYCESGLSCRTRKIQPLCFLQCPSHSDKLPRFAM